MRSVEWGADMNIFHAAFVAAVSGGEMGSWKAGQGTITARRWVIW